MRGPCPRPESSLSLLSAAGEKPGQQQGPSPAGINEDKEERKE